MLFSQYPYHNFSDYNLDWCIKIVKELYPRLEALEDWKSQFEEDYAQIKEFYNDIMNGIFPDGFYDAIRDWLERNALDLIGELVKTVFFGLTDSGYFVAYIPESWDDITFHTSEYDVFMSDFDTYGHLVLSY